MFIASVITYRVTVVPCPGVWLTKVERILFRSLWYGKPPHVKRSIYCQKPLKGMLGIHWLMMHMYALKLRYLWFYLHGERVSSAHVIFFLQQLMSPLDVSAWTMRRPKLSEW